MKVEYVQVTAADSARPIHALLVVIDEDGNDYEIEHRTVCQRLAGEDMARPALPFTPFVNTEHDRRCAGCEYALQQMSAGMPVGITRYERVDS